MGKQFSLIFHSLIYLGKGEREQHCFSFNHQFLTFHFCFQKKKFRILPLESSLNGFSVLYFKNFFKSSLIPTIPFDKYFRLGFFSSSFYFFSSSDSFNEFMSLDDGLLEVQDLSFAIISFNMNIRGFHVHISEEF
jgi:hypothetical protein